MTSSVMANHVDRKNVNIKFELPTFTSNKMISTENIYKYLFKNVEPSNEDKINVTIHFPFIILEIFLM